MNDRPRPVTSAAFGQALVKAGILDSVDDVSRIVIDARVSAPLMLYVERYGDERWLEVAPPMAGVQVTTAPVSALAPDPTGELLNRVWCSWAVQPAGEQYARTASPVWVMDKGWYLQVRLWATRWREDPVEPDPDKWEPDADDRLFGRPIRVSHDGGEPHLEAPGPLDTLLGESR